VLPQVFFGKSDTTGDVGQSAWTNDSQFFPQPNTVPRQEHFTTLSDGTHLAPTDHAVRSGLISEFLWGHPIRRDDDFTLLVAVPRAVFPLRNSVSKRRPKLNTGPAELFFLG
jgi:hypothetical protein